MEPDPVIGSAFVTTSLEPEGAELRAGVEFGQAEVQDFDAAAGQDDVGGFEIAMDDSLGVGGGEGIRDLNGVLQHPFERHRPLFIACARVSPSTNSITR